MLEESLDLYRSRDDPPGVAHALVNLGSALYLAGDVSRTEALLEDSVELYRDQALGLAGRGRSQTETLRAFALDEAEAIVQKTR